MTHAPITPVTPVTPTSLPVAPLISVIMSVYNGASFVGDAIQSIRQQTFCDFEMIIVDDGSTDATAAILEKASADDPRIRVLTQPRIGRARALNTALAAAKGKYIAVLDADDLAEPQRLEVQLAHLQAHPELGMLGTSHKILVRDEPEARIKKQLLTDGDLRRALVRENPFFHSSVMIPRHVFDVVGTYDVRLPIMLDYDLWIRIAGKFPMANLAEPLATQRVHDQAYFQSRRHTWGKFANRVNLRWRAWRTLSRSVPDLRFVVIEPVAWYLMVHAKRLVKRVYPTRRGTHVRP